MILQITFIVMILASVLIRFKLYRRLEIKQYEVLTSLMFLLFIGFVSYWVTDHYIGMIYSILLFTTFLAMSIGTSIKSNVINFLAPLIGFPLLFLLYLKTIDYYLISEVFVFNLIYIPILILRLNINSNIKQSKYMYLGLVIGLCTSAALYFAYHDSLDQNRQCFQEKIAESYLVNELNVSSSSIFAERKIRGVASGIIARAKNNTLIHLIYNNGKIISYEILKK